MTNLHYNSQLNEESRRQRLYEGDLFVFSARPSTRAFGDFARAQIAEAFGTMDPETAQHEMPVEDYIALLQELKPRFIHHPEAKTLLRALVEDFDCDPDRTYYEVPKMRTSTSDDYLTAGIAYAWHPHRDTWYSAPQCQINWWLPIFEICAENCMAFHPRYFDERVENSSDGYNYYEWNEKYRGTSLSHYVNKDPRPLPAPLSQIDHSADILPICERDGMILFSAAHLHSSVPNFSGKTRFSFDFRTANHDDLALGLGAPNVDSACTGTVLNEFLRVSDHGDLPTELLSLYEDGTENLGRSRYQG